MRYRIKDLAPGLDGLIVEGDLNASGYVFVKKISNESIIVGDRSVSVPVAGQGLAVGDRFLQKLDDAPKEYAHNNPFGEVLFEGRCGRGTLEVVYTQYENGLAVTVREKTNIVRTLYAQNFFGDAAYIREVKTLIEDAFADDDGAESLIFQLRDMKEQED